MSTQAYVLRRMIDPWINFDILLRADGTEISFHDDGEAERQNDHLLRWEKAHLPVGTYWWMRLSHYRLSAMELIVILGDEASHLPTIVSIDVSDSDTGAILAECCEYATDLPARLTQIVLATTYTFSET